MRNLIKKSNCKFLLLGLFVLIVCFGFIAKNITVSRPINQSSITLADNEIWGKDKPEIIGEMWSGTLNIEKDSLINEIPISLRVIEHSESAGNYNFDEFRSILLNYFLDTHTPYQYEYLGFNGANSYGGCNCETLKITGRSIFNKSPTARKDLVLYAIDNYNKISNYFPASWKKYYINKMEKLILFTKNYIVNRNNYLKIYSNESSYIDMATKPENQLLNNIGLYESFIFRRIEVDKVPSQEILSYLIIIKKCLINSLKNEFSNYCDLNVNNEINISDVSYDYIDGLKIKIWNNNLNKDILVSGFNGIKYFSNNNKSYYLIYYK